MPTKKNTLEFIKAYKGALNIKAPTSKSVSELNKAVDKAVEKVPKEIANKWKRMKLIEDKSPSEMADFMRQLKRQQIKEGTIGKSAPVPKVARDKKKQATNIDEEISNLMKASERVEAREKAKKAKKPAAGGKTECRMLRRKDKSVYKKCYKK